MLVGLRLPEKAASPGSERRHAPGGIAEIQVGGGGCPTQYQIRTNCSADRCAPEYAARGGVESIDCAVLAARKQPALVDGRPRAHHGGIRESESPFQFEVFHVGGGERAGGFP